MTPPSAMTSSVATLPAPACAPARPSAADPAPPAVQVQALSLTEPLPGFPEHRDYVLVPAEDSGRLFWLQSLAPDGHELPRHGGDGPRTGLEPSDPVLIAVVGALALAAAR